MTMLFTHFCAQGRPLADWTDYFQSGPAPKGAPRYTLLTCTNLHFLLNLLM